jgi:hypothetical protein
MRNSSSSGAANAARLVMAAALLGATAAAGVMFACSSDTGATTDDDAGTASGDSGTGNVQTEPPDQELTDGPFMSHADAGCPVKFVGPNPGTVATSVPRADDTAAVAWQTPENALEVDGKFGVAMLDEGQTSEHLRITGYGFKLPPAANIKGVVLQLKRQGDLAILDGKIELWLGDRTTDRPKFVSSGWPKIVGTHHYGQEVDTWGNDLTPQMFESPNFGAQIYAKRRPDAGAGPMPANVESILITVWYCD